MVYRRGELLEAPAGRSTAIARTVAIMPGKKHRAWLNERVGTVEVAPARGRGVSFGAGVADNDECESCQELAEHNPPPLRNTTIRSLTRTLLEVERGGEQFHLPGLDRCWRSRGRRAAGISGEVQGLWMVAAVVLVGWSSAPCPDEVVAASRACSGGGRAAAGGGGAVVEKPRSAVVRKQKQTKSLVFDLGREPLATAANRKADRIWS